MRISVPLLGAALVLFLGATGCSSSQTNAEADEIDKRGLLAAQTDTQGAMKIWEEGLGTYGNNLRMRFHLGRLQFDTGEIQFIEERHCMRDSRLLEDEGKLADSQKKALEGKDRHAKGLPFYRAARENLTIVVAKESDSARNAWACYLLARCDIFFEDYEAAANHLDRAIDLGRPTGAQLASWKEYLSEIRRERDKHTPRTSIDNMLAPGH